MNEWYPLPQLRFIEREGSEHVDGVHGAFKRITITQTLQQGWARLSGGQIDWRDVPIERLAQPTGLNDGQK